MRLTHRDIEKVGSLPRGRMDEFKGRGIEVYRSTVYDRTTTYFGDREKNPCYHELVVFEYEFGKPEYFIRLPYYEFFIELSSSGKSAHGTMEHFDALNPIGDFINPYHYEGELQNQFIEVFRHDTDAMIKIGKYGDFDFLQRMGFQPVKYSHRNERAYGEDVIWDVFSREYVKIPDFRNIAYSAVTGDGNYLIVDQSAYNFSYEGMRCWFGPLSDIKPASMENFARYRDGGTTLFDFIVDGVKHSFFWPSRLGENKGYQTINEKPIKELDETTLNLLLKKIGINLKPR
jgi:hypothetical protein